MALQIENSKDRYGTAAQVLHWTIAILFAGSFASVYFRQWFTQGGSVANQSALQLHLSIGLSILVFAGLRIWWRARSRVMPDELPGAWWEHLSAKLAHIGLYAMMLAMPLTGYLGTGLATEFFGLFTVPRFADTAVFDLLVTQGLEMTFDEFEKPIDWLHKTLGEILVLALVGLHVLAALFHHYVRRDGVMRRMVP